MNCLRLNIVTDDEYYVHSCLIHAFSSSSHGVKCYLANRPAEGIVEFDLVADERCCISLESVIEALPFLERWNIRFVVPDNRN